MQNISKLEKVSFVIFQIFIFLLPIFFIPSFSVNFQSGKTAFIIYGVLVLTILWLVSRLKDGVFSAPKSFWYGSSLILIVTYLLSGLFSDNKAVSIYGQFFDIGTVGFFVTSLVLFLLIPLIVKSQKQILISYGSILASFLLIAIFHGIRFFTGPEFLSYGFFDAMSSNMLGKWNDVAIFFGFISIVSLITIDRSKLSGFVRVLFWPVLLISLAMLTIVNFSIVWIILGFISLIVLVYELSLGKKDKAPIATIVTLIISAFFIFGGASVGNLISDKLGVSQIEVRPSWNATLDVTIDSIKENPILGAGPNRFSSQWLSYKPDGINSTIFWGTDFNYGIGFLSTLPATTGLVGTISLLLFIVLYVLLLIKGLLYKGASNFSRYLSLTSLFGSAYLVIVSVFYLPSQTIWILTVISLGLLIASLRDEGIIDSVSFSTLEKPTANFLSVLLIIFALIGTVSVAYFVGNQFASNIYLQKSVNEVSVSGNVDSIESYALKAYRLFQNDTYARYLSDISLARLNGLFNQTDVSQAEAQQKFQSYFGSAVSYAQQAISLDNTNYLNYITLGRIYESVVPLEISGAYEGAKQSYESAIALNPENPQLYIFLARLEFVNKNNSLAKEYVVKALEKKGDYADAVYMLVQIQIAEGEYSQAVSSLEALTTVLPNDPVAFFQLGSLYYDRERYDDATFALNKAIQLNPNYADAKYLLGFTMYLNGYKIASLNQFKQLLAENPENTDLMKIVENLEAGKSPRGN